MCDVGSECSRFFFAFAGDQVFIFLSDPEAEQNGEGKCLDAVEVVDSRGERHLSASLKLKNKNGICVFIL